MRLNALLNGIVLSALPLAVHAEPQGRYPGLGDNAVNRRAVIDLGNG